MGSLVARVQYVRNRIHQQDLNWTKFLLDCRGKSGCYLKTTRSLSMFTALSTVSGDITKTSHKCALIFRFSIVALDLAI